MKRSILQLTGLTALLGCLAGCSICCSPYDEYYPAIGGKMERVNPTQGRVGSVFSDPNAVYSGEGPDSNLSAPPELQRNLDLENLENIVPLDSDPPTPSNGEPPGDRQTFLVPELEGLRY